MCAVQHLSELSALCVYSVLECSVQICKIETNDILHLKNFSQSSLTLRLCVHIHIHVKSQRHKFSLFKKTRKFGSKKKNEKGRKQSLTIDRRQQMQAKKKSTPKTSTTESSKERNFAHNENGSVCHCKLILLLSIPYVPTNAHMHNASENVRLSSFFFVFAFAFYQSYIMCAFVVE